MNLYLLHAPRKARKAPSVLPSLISRREKARASLVSSLYVGAGRLDLANGKEFLPFSFPKAPKQSIEYLDASAPMTRVFQNVFNAPLFSTRV